MAQVQDLSLLLSEPKNSLTCSGSLLIYLPNRKGNNYPSLQRFQEIKHIFIEHLKHVKHWHIHQRHRIEEVFKHLQFNGKANKRKVNDEC